MPGAHPVVVLSHDAWRRRLAPILRLSGAPSDSNGRTFAVVGVGPPRFAGTSVEHAADFFVPVMHAPGPFTGTVL